MRGGALAFFTSCAGGAARLGDGGGSRWPQRGPWKRSFHGFGAGAPWNFKTECRPVCEHPGRRSVLRFRAACSLAEKKG